VEQEQLTFQEHMSSHPVFSGPRVSRSLVLCVRFVGRCSKRPVQLVLITTEALSSNPGRGEEYLIQH
jgi:hypothetical protein